jgi:hypothetical protein
MEEAVASGNIRRGSQTVILSSLPSFGVSGIPGAVVAPPTTPPSADPVTISTLAAGEAVTLALNERLLHDFATPKTALQDFVQFTSLGQNASLDALSIAQLKSLVTDLNSIQRHSKQKVQLLHNDIAALDAVDPLSKPLASGENSLLWGECVLILCSLLCS